jgi:hypothetical protein
LYGSYINKIENLSHKKPRSSTNGGLDAASNELNSIIDQSCPITWQIDCGSDLMAHVRTQLPLALIAAGISAVLYTVIGLFILT